MVYFYLCLGLLILLGGGKFLVDGASSLALKLGLSQGLVGLTIVALGTSAPELLVSINAALNGKSDISIGNVIGSNIANVSLVLGFSAILFPININYRVLKVEFPIVLLSSFIFYFFSYNGLVSRVEGILLLGLLVSVNVFFFLTMEKQHTENLEKGNMNLSLPIWKAIFFLFIGIFGLYYGADLFVKSAVDIAEYIGVTERVIGITVIALGTSLPEMATSVIAALNKKTEIAIGNILGSNIMNGFAILGASALISPIGVSEIFLKQDFIWMLGLTLILFPIFKTGGKVSRMEGLLLFVLYFFYVFLSL